MPQPARVTPQDTRVASRQVKSRAGLSGFHLEAGSGPMVNPFPLSRDRSRGRANAHHNPMQPFRDERRGRYRPRVRARIPRQIPDQRFDELFARLVSHR